MTDFAFPPPPPPSAEVAGTSQRFPVHRIYCVGRNYAEHIREMGGDIAREPPVFFTKPADAVVANGTDVPYPSRTSNLHHEIELVIAIGRGGRNIGKEKVLEHIFGYAAGNDLTRRFPLIVQAVAKLRASSCIIDGEAVAWWRRWDCLLRATSCAVGC